MYVLAEKLHMTVEQIGHMTAEEFNGWIAYYQLKAEKYGNV